VVGECTDLGEALEGGVVVGAGDAGAEDDSLGADEGLGAEAGDWLDPQALTVRSMATRRPKGHVLIRMTDLPQGDCDALIVVHHT
jgi:hypothetical protein